MTTGYVYSVGPVCLPLPPGEGWGEGERKVALPRKEA